MAHCDIIFIDFRQFLQEGDMLFRMMFFAGLLCWVPSAFADNPVPSDSDEVITVRASEAWRERRLATGRETYQHACASCHDEGVEGAPAIGNREAWASRSPLWSAVLFEHSREGYLGMPAKGGHDDLSEQEVDAASEYLLSETFPEMPLD
jgi:cytochrome c5